MAASNGSVLRRLDASGVPLLIARLALGGLFIYMGAAKADHPIDFLKQIRLYHMLPESPGIFLNAAAIVLPWLEIVAGVALILGLWVRGAAATLAIMLVAFTPAILLRAFAIHSAEGTPFFAIEFDCGCGAGVIVTWKKVLENTGLFLLTLVPLLSGSRRFCAAMWWEHRRPKASYCHLCGYAVDESVAGLCEACATPPTFPLEASEATS